ncbi:MAG: phosphatase [Microscillaceae bacterium]|nr:phosphatase [Microscillaceae bacterium]MDW8460838.1 phosphatase [Cytophagales bacterium]
MQSSIFENLGARFLLPPHRMAEQFKHIQALILDWDGVFNNGQKTTDKGSPYSEADSAGTNLLRFAKWLQTTQQIKIAIITGAGNETAFQLALREHFHAVYSKIIDKKLALLHFCQTYQLEPRQTACFFDDAIDLPMAELCGLRFLIHRKASPLFEQFVVQHQLCDYISACEGGNYAVREICEMLISLQNIYEKTLSSRLNFDEHYQTYWKERNQIETQFFTSREQEIIPNSLINKSLQADSISH